MSNYTLTVGVSEDVKNKLECMKRDSWKVMGVEGQFKNNTELFQNIFALYGIIFNALASGDKVYIEKPTGERDEIECAG